MIQRGEKRSGQGKNTRIVLIIAIEVEIEEIDIKKRQETEVDQKKKAIERGIILEKEKDQEIIQESDLDLNPPIQKKRNLNQKSL